MKITVVSGGGRKKGNGEFLVKKALENFEHSNADIKTFHLNDMNIHPCKGCFACRKKEVCVWKDDMNILLKRIEESDFVIFQTPVFMYDATGSFMTMVNRLYPMLGGEAGHYTKRHEGIRAMLILTQGAPAFFQNGVTKRLKNTLNHLGFQIEGIVKAGLCNQRDTASKNKKLIKKIDKICRQQKF